MVKSIYRPTRITIHTEAIRENLRTVQEHLSADQSLFAVIKANGYGHGAVQVAKIAEEEGVAGFCVATIDEGIELREAGITLPVFILGLVDCAYLPIVSQYQLAIPVASTNWLKQAEQAYLKNPWDEPIAVHLAIETGMGRIGFIDSGEVKQAEVSLAQAEGFYLEGVFTHFATADQADATYWQEQKARFFETIAVLEAPRYVHVTNSATQLWHEPLGNLVRYGVAMYGLNPSSDALQPSYSLVPALSLTSQLVQVKQLPSGSGVGYGHTYETTQDEWIGTVPIGYADGYVRKLQGFHVLVNGQFCEIVGRVCMDQLMIRLPADIPVGTTVTLIGTDGDKTISLQDVASYIGTIHYEVACLLSERLPREYE